MRPIFLLAVIGLLAACSSNHGSQTGGPGELTEWPEHRQGQNPPEAPSEFAPIVTNADALAGQLPQSAINRLFDPTAFGSTMNALRAPVVREHTVRAVLAHSV